MSDALTDDSTDVVRGLAYMAAERCLKSLELAADLHGVGTHIFPAAEDFGPSDAMTVTFCDAWPGQRPYVYTRYLVGQPKEEVDRATALKHLATDKAIRALQ